MGSTLNLPMQPKTPWSAYQQSLETGLEAIVEFGAQAVVVSMGLDTLDGDPCAIRGAGFCLVGNDYAELGCTMSRWLKELPVLIIQEGGYRMDAIGEAATKVVSAYAEERKQCQ